MVGVVSRLLGQVISFVSIAAASRFLSLEIFGTYALAWAATVIGTTFVFTGLYQALLRTREFSRDRNTLFWLNTCVGGVFALGIALFGLMAGGLDSSQGLALLALAPIPLLSVPTAWWEAQLVRAKRVRAASLYVLFSEICGLAATILMLARGWQIEALIAPRYVSLAVGTAVTAFLVRRLPRLGLCRDTIRTAARTAFPLWGTSSIHLFTNYGTDIILGAFAAPATVGAYRGGARIAITASNLVLQPLTMLTWSRFAGLERSASGLRTMRESWMQNMSVGAAILWPMNATVALFAPALVVTIFDETWLSAAGAVAILSVSRAIGFGGALLEPVLITAGEARQPLLIRLWGGGTLLVLLLVFARFGAEAAALAHLASSVVTAVLSLNALGRSLDLTRSHLARVFWPGLVLTVVTAGVVAASEFAFGPVAGVADLSIRLLSISVCWLVLILLFFRKRILVLPTP